ncbi:MAG: Ig-like domain-containing protein, partial [Clostridia bacterium]
VVKAVATDGFGASVEAPFNVTVTPKVNHPPVVVKTIPDQTIAVGETKELDISDVISDPDNDGLIWSASSSDTSKAIVSIGGPSIKLVTKGLTEGNLTVTVGAKDGSGASVETTFNLAVTPKVNHPPVATDKTTSIQSNVTIVGTLPVTDSDGDPLTFKIVKNGSKGTAVITNEETGAFTYTADPNAVGYDTFTFQASDGQADSNIGVYIINFITNHPPVVMKTIPDQTIRVGETKSIAIDGLFSDPDNDALSLSVGTDHNGTIIDYDYTNTLLTIHGLTPGVTQIDVSVIDNSGNSADTSFNVRVIQQSPPPPTYYPVTGVELDHTELTLTAGKEPVTLLANVKPDYATNKQVIWESNDPTIAAVDQNGLVTPLTQGNAIIRVRTVDGDKTAECLVKVQAAATDSISVELDQHELSLEAGGEVKQLTATVLPEDAPNKGVIWKSSNRKVAKVDKNGVVTPVSAGQATITVTTKEGGKTDSCLVTVVPEEIVKLEVSERNLLLKPKESVKIDIYAVNKSGKKKNITTSRLTKIVSSDSKIAEFKGTTVKAGKKEGKATLTITYKGQKLEVPVVVSNIAVDRLIPTSKSATLEPGKSKQLELKALMSDKSKKDVTELATWSSSNPEIVTVDENGELTAQKAGTVKITATYGGKTVTITVTVKKKR